MFHFIIQVHGSVESCCSHCRANSMQRLAETLDCCCWVFMCLDNLAQCGTVLCQSGECFNTLSHSCNHKVLHYQQILPESRLLWCHLQLLNYPAGPLQAVGAEQATTSKVETATTGTATARPVIGATSTRKYSPFQRQVAKGTPHKACVRWLSKTRYSKLCHPLVHLSFG